jgi:hypothetical protein
VSHAFINTNGDYMLELHDEILIEANAVAELERERIIKLLEEVLQFDSEDEKRNLFALITGGQK